MSRQSEVIDLLEMFEEFEDLFYCQYLLATYILLIFMIKHLQKQKTKCQFTQQQSLNPKKYTSNFLSATSFRLVTIEVE